MDGQDPNVGQPEVPDAQSKNPDEIIVVGVGASAGGLEAITEFLLHLPSQTNMAFVVIQHLDPRHESSLPELLAGKTGMRVVPVQHDMRLEPAHVYVISPNTLLRVQDGGLLAAGRERDSLETLDVF